MVFTTVGAACRGGRIQVKNRLKVAAAGAGRVGASVLGTGVIEGAQGADRSFGQAAGGDVTEAPAVPALGVAVGGVCPHDHAGPRQVSD